MKVEGLPRNTSIHACFDENTLITTDKGLKPIIEVQVGDMVLTHKNRFKPVVNTIETDTDTVYVLKTSASAPIEVTGNHPFYIKENKNSDPIWKSVEEIDVNNDYIGIAINQNSIIPKRKDLLLPFDNEDFWWIIGYYIGKGFLKNNKAVLKDDVELIKRLSNLELYFITYINNIYIYNEQMVAYIKEIEEDNTQLNKDIFDLPINMIKSLIEGYISANNINSNSFNKYIFNIENKELAIGFMQLINKAYNYPATFEIIEVNKKEIYQVTFMKDIISTDNSFFYNGYLWTKVVLLDKLHKEQKMYNLTVYEDSSYVVCGLIAHNCGTIISPGDITKYCPQVYIKNEETGKLEGTTQFTMGECEEIGLLKMDFLSLRTMTILQESVSDINNLYKKDISIDDIPLFDAKVYEHISKGNTTGVFQLESAGMTSFMGQLFQDVSVEINKIKKLSKTKADIEFDNLGNQLFERVIAGISLYRPGPMDEIPNYIKGMLSPANVKYETPMLENILKTTYGVIVYQEQVIQIVRELAGFSKGQADLIRKSMGKKIQAILDEYKPYFIYGSADKVDEKTKKPLNIAGCVSNGINEDIAIKIWGLMENFAKYAFNKSHAGGYGVLAVKTAWLSYYYPVIFMKANLNIYINQPDKVRRYLSYCSKKGIKLLTPSINKSDMLFTVEGDNIRFGLKGIKNIGVLAELIIKEREKRGYFKSYQDFVQRMVLNEKLNSRAIESLILSGALDEFEGSRKSKILILERLLDIAKGAKTFKNSGQSTIFDLANSLGLNKIERLRLIKTPNEKEFDKEYLLNKEEECTGFFITEHPLDEYIDVLQKEEVIDIAKLTNIDETTDEEDFIIDENPYVGCNVRVAGIIYDLETKYTKKDNKPFFLFKIKDKSGELNSICFSDMKDKNEDKIKEGKKVIIDGILEHNDFGYQLTVSSVKDLSLVDFYKISSISVIHNNNDILFARKQWKALLFLCKHNKGDIPIRFILNDKEYSFPEKICLNLETLLQIQNIFNERNCDINYK